MVGWSTPGDYRTMQVGESSTERMEETCNISVMKFLNLYFGTKGRLNSQKLDDW
jgi:hypothetical protein